MVISLGPRWTKKKVCSSQNEIWGDIRVKINHVICRRIRLLNSIKFWPNYKTKTCVERNSVSETTHLSSSLKFHLEFLCWYDGCVTWKWALRWARFCFGGGGGGKKFSLMLGANTRLVCLLDHKCHTIQVSEFGAKKDLFTQIKVSPKWFKWAALCYILLVHFMSIILDSTKPSHRFMFQSSNGQEINHHKWLARKVKNNQYSQFTFDI